MFASPAAAQDDGFSLTRFRATPTAHDGFGLHDTETLGHLGFSGKLTLDYAHAPLVLSQRTGDERDEVGAVVENSFVATLSAALGLSDFLVVWADFPITLVSSGDDLSSSGGPGTPSSAGAGDLGIGVGARLLGGTGRAEDLDLRLALHGSVLFPTGSGEALAGDGGVGARFAATLAIATPSVVPIVSLGVAYRPENDYASATLGSELFFGVGARVPIGIVRLEAELRAVTTLVGGQAFEGTASPFEALVGARFELGELFFAGLGVAIGLNDGVGVPDVRVLGSFAVALPGSEPGEDDEEEEEQEEVIGPPADDADGDGVPDGDDFCPDQPETENMVEDSDGCPDGVERTDSHFVVRPGLVFDEGSADLDDLATDLLALVVDALQEHEDVELIQIEGHTSEDEGDPDEALDLAERRADAVRSWLIEHGVDSGRLTSVGVGSDNPLPDAETEENRRVEFRILDL